MTDIKDIQKQILIILNQVKVYLYSNPNFTYVNTKTNRNDLVTDRDIQIEKEIVTFLREKYPRSQIVSEEGLGNNPVNLTGLVFFVDPIDGTMNFVKCHDQFASMVGVYEDGKPIFGAIVDVMKNQIFYGGPQVGAFVNGEKLMPLVDVPLEEALITVSNYLLQNEMLKYQNLVQQSSGLRIFGSAGIVFTRLLTGKEHLYVGKFKPWDLAAGRAIGQCLGINVTTIDSEPLNMIKSQLVIVGTRCATQQALDVLSRV